MNIKSLLLGSTAALVAVTGARAADAVVIAEPEPVEYVRVCDTYGTGFYYIPGTEICIKIGGYVRYDIGFGDLFGDTSDTGDDTWHKRGRFALRVDARTETELGTLQGKAQINFDWTTSNQPLGNRFLGDLDGDGIVDIGEFAVGSDFDARYSTGMERAWVKLGGFLIGVEDSFFTTWTGYASGVVNDGLIAYGPFTTHTIQYVWDGGNGFSVGAAVEEGADGGFGTIIQDYAPHATVGAKFGTGVFAVSVVGGYDSVQDEFSAKGRVDITPSDMFSFFVMGGWTDDDDGNGGNYYATWGGDWAIWAGTAIKVNDRITLNGEFGYNDFGDYSVDADVNITVVPGFVVTPGVGWKHFDAIDDDQIGGYVRTQFTF
jgi:opacity protein-like surface antigen